MFFNCGEGISSDHKSAQYETIRKMFRDPKTKAYAMFLSNIIPFFNELNKNLQQEKPCIHNLRQKLHMLFVNLIARLVKPSAVSKADDILSLNLNKKENQKTNKYIVVGAKTRQFLNSRRLSAEDCDIFFISIRNFFVFLTITS